MSKFNSANPRLVSGDLKVGSKVTVTVVIESDRQMDYVVVKSPRPAAFEPVQQLSRPLWNFGLKTYIELAFSRRQY